MPTAFTPRSSLVTPVGTTWLSYFVKTGPRVAKEVGLIIHHRKSGDHRENKGWKTSISTTITSLVVNVVVLSYGLKIL